MGSKASSFYFYHINSGKTSENRHKNRSWDILSVVPTEFQPVAIKNYIKSIIFIRNRKHLLYVPYSSPDVILFSLYSWLCKLQQKTDIAKDYGKLCIRTYTHREKDCLLPKGQPYLFCSVWDWKL